MNELPLALPGQISHEQNRAEIFRPIEFRRRGPAHDPSLVVKNRLFRSSIAGTFDHYNGRGTEARRNWEERFARGSLYPVTPTDEVFAHGGLGAIISSFVPVSIRGRIMIRYATIGSDDRIDFWKEVAERVHRYQCKYILQLSHSGHQQDLGGVENLFKRSLSSTSRMDYFHGILSQAMSKTEIRATVRDFAEGARRARDAGLDGVELHGANGYLITQFLSSGINDRRDEYGGPVPNRARFVLDIVHAIRDKVGDFHLQMKINGEDHDNWLYPWRKRGNTLAETIEICQILEDHGNGVDAFHVSSGSTFPHPRNPPGDFPLRDAARCYAAMRGSGVRGKINDFIFHHPILGQLFRHLWHYRRGPVIEGINAVYAREIKKAVHVPVLVTGGFQHASTIAALIRNGWCDGVTMARPLIANPDLPHLFQKQDGPDPGKECTYCNKCLINDLANPLGCYELSRYDGATFEEKYDNMMETIMSIFFGSNYP
jgi:2,4-dienoyl-CoA reductase (NADPH2)